MDLRQTILDEAISAVALALTVDEAVTRLRQLRDGAREERLYRVHCERCGGLVRVDQPAG